VKEGWLMVLAFGLFWRKSSVFMSAMSQKSGLAVVAETMLQKKGQYVSSFGPN